MLNIYTKDFGKIEAIARGARKAKGKLKGHLELFLLVDLVLANGRSIDTITSSAAMESFLNLRNNLEISFGAYYLIELADRMTIEGHKDERVFYLLKKSLMFLDGLARENNSLLSQPPKLNYSAIQKRDFVISSLSEKSAVSANSSYTDFSRGAQNDSYRTAWQLDGAIINKYYPSILIFQIHILNLSGFSPELDKCVICGKSIKPGENYFSFSRGGVAGKECSLRKEVERPIGRSTSLFPISDNTIKLIRLFQFKGNSKLGNKNSLPDKGACLSGRQGWGVRDKFYLNKCFETIRKLKADKKLVLDAVFLMNKFIEFNIEKKVKAVDFLREA